MIVRPRLNDFHNLPFTQEQVDFAIPFLDEDIPLYLDPFLLWKSRKRGGKRLQAIEDGKSIVQQAIRFLKNLRSGVDSDVGEHVVRIHSHGHTFAANVLAMIKHNMLFWSH